MRCRSSARRAPGRRAPTRSSTACISTAIHCRSRRKAPSPTRSNIFPRSCSSSGSRSRIFFTRGFDVIHACNPPDTDLPDRRALQAARRQALRVRPPRHQPGAVRGEVRPARSVLAPAAVARAHDLPHRRRRHRHQRVLPAHRHRARRHGAERVFVVRSGPDLARMQALPPRTRAEAAAGAHLVGYVGVIGQQEGIDLLLQAVRVIVRRPRPRTTSSSAWSAAGLRSAEHGELLARSSASPTTSPSPGASPTTSCWRCSTPPTSASTPTGPTR